MKNYWYMPDGIPDISYKYFKWLTMLNQTFHVDYN